MPSPEHDSKASTQLLSKPEPQEPEPEENEFEAQYPAKLARGISSRHTVLTISGLFVVGLMCVASGIIILCTPHNNMFTAFNAAGIGFLTLGLLMWALCFVLQRKNFYRNVDRIEKKLVIF